MIKKAIKSFLLLGTLQIIIIIGIVVAIIMSVAGSGNKSSDNIIIVGQYNENVEAYREIIQKYCIMYNTKKDDLDLESYVNLALAIMTVESHGIGSDPMQASESGYNELYPRKPGGITDAEYSCAAGVQVMRDALILAKVESPNDIDRIAVAVQGYNFGMYGWIKWISERGGKYTLELAEEYSRDCMPEGAKGTPSHAQKVMDVYVADDYTIVEGVDDPMLLDVINASESEAWQAITGKYITSKPTWGMVTQSEMDARIVAIPVQVWQWKNPGKNSDLEKVATTKTICVNKYLKTYYASFFAEVFNHPSKIVIEELGSYCFRMNTGGTGMSSHSFGTAIDINWSSKGNGYGDTPYTKDEWVALPETQEKYETIYKDSPLVQIAYKYTMNWGGDWNSVKDGMHFSFVGDGKTREQLRAMYSSK